MVKRGLGLLVAVLTACGVAGAVALGAPGDHSKPVTFSEPSLTSPTTEPAPTGISTTSTTSTSTTVISPANPSTSNPAPRPATLAGCPVRPKPGPATPPTAPWHPDFLVPDSALPPIQEPAPWHSSLSAITGTGMWIWQWSATSGGDPRAIVAQAVRAGLHQLWVRVGDSKYGFYGASELESLVPLAHAAGIAVVAWGFPYLYDPVGDTRWTAQILSWQSAGGQRIDAYSADIERPSEGVDLTARRVAVYLGGVRKVAGNRPVIATVYPPADTNWYGTYPYSTMAAYVDAFAPMVYWECSDPGKAAVAAIQRLATLKPVHVIGQAFNMGDVGGREVPPSAAEVTEFLSQARGSGAVGGSFWVWQSASADEWAAISAFRW